MKISIRFKILGPCILLFVLSLSILFAYAYSTSSTALQKVSLQGLSQTTANISQLIDVWIQEKTKVISVFSQNEGFRDLLQGNEKESALKDSMEYINFISDTYPEFSTLGIIDSHGLVLAHSDSGNNGALRLDDREYFQKAMDGELNLSKTIISKVTGAVIFVIAAPIEYEGEIIGVIYGTVSFLDFSQKFISDIKIGDEGYGYLTNSEGLVLVHPEKDLVLSYSVTEEDFGKDMLERKNGVLEYDWEGGVKISAFSQVPSTGWLVVAGVEHRDLLSAVFTMRNNVAFVSLLEVILISIILFLVTHRFIKSIKIVADHTASLSQGEGDLSYRLNIKTKDELEDLSDQFNLFLESLSHIIRNIQNGAGTTLEANTKLETSVEVMMVSFEQIRQHMDGIGRLTDDLDGRMSESVKDISHVSTDISHLSDQVVEQMAAVEESTASVNEMVASIANVASITERKRETTEQLRESAREGDEQLKETTTAVAQVTENIDSVNQMVAIINSIAAQTNLLAMNAAIEAAHAGDAGRGFAVVADEIRKLAEESSSSASNINSIMQQMVGFIQNASQASESSSVKFSEIFAEIQGVSQSFEEILQSTQELNLGGNQILQAMTILSETSSVVKDTSAQAKDQLDKAVSAVDKTAEITGEVRSEVEGISLDVEKSHQALAMVNDQTQKINDTTESLNKEVGRFTL
jgi:methyl-accepting chemotaxis protein